jgi:hypothetical protein
MQGKNPTNLKLPKHVLASQQFNARHRSADEIRLEEGTSFGIIRCDLFIVFFIINVCLEGDV